MSEAANGAHESATWPIAEIDEAPKDVNDLALGANIVGLGLLYGRCFDGDSVLEIDLTLTTPACPLTDLLEAQIDEVLKNLVDGRNQMQALGFNI